jgi:hypothetical protein
VDLERALAARGQGRHAGETLEAWAARQPDAVTRDAIARYATARYEGRSDAEALAGLTVR